MALTLAQLFAAFQQFREGTGEIRAAKLLAAWTLGSNGSAGALVASPTGTSNTGGVMLGLSNSAPGNIITPQNTGRVAINICGVVAQNTSGDGANWNIRTGTGAAPANGAALTGTVTGGTQSMTFLTGVLKIPFAISSYVVGLTIGTPLWIDLAFAAVTGGTVTMTQVMTTAFEF